MNAAVQEQKAIDWSAAGRPMIGQTVSGDLHVVKPFKGGFLLALIDGVGHGDEAQAAAKAAADVLKKNPGDSVISLIKCCHHALAETRGAVMTLASVDVPGKTVTWMGVGNVEAWLFRAEAEVSHPREHILLRAGLVGLQLPAAQATLIPLMSGDLMVFATDGIEPGFEVGIDPTDTSKRIAQGILAQHSKGTDDALVLVVRYLGHRP